MSTIEYVTGPSGSGKTAALMRRQRPGDVAVLAPKIMAGATVLGYDILLQPGGRRFTLCRPWRFCISPMRQGRWYFDPQAFEVARWHAILWHLTLGGKVTIDEVGPIEARRQGHYTLFCNLKTLRAPMSISVRNILIYAVQ